MNILSPVLLPLMNPFLCGLQKLLSHRNLDILEFIILANNLFIELETGILGIIHIS